VSPHLYADLDRSARVFGSLGIGEGAVYGDNGTTNALLVPVGGDAGLGAMLRTLVARPSERERSLEDHVAAALDGGSP
jgi:hypothetical protein